MYQGTVKKSHEEAVRELIDVAEDVRYIKPAHINKEIELKKLKEVGPKYAPAVERAARNQPTSMFGSGTIVAGASDLSSGRQLKKCVRYPNDFDAYTNNPDKFKRDVARYTGGRVIKDKSGKLKVISKNGEEIGVDMHPFPKEYPDIGQTHSEIDDTKYKLKIYPKKKELTIPGKTPGYKGKITYEQMNVQTSKSFSDLITNLNNPMKKGYRIPKSASRTELLAKDLISVEKRRKITPARKKSLDKLVYKLNKAYDRRITYRDETGRIRTEEIDDAGDRYLASKLNKKPSVKKSGNPSVLKNTALIKMKSIPISPVIKIKPISINLGLFNGKKKKRGLL